MTNLVNEMEKSIGKDVAVFHKFLLDNKSNDNTLFSFVEGKDFCYYNPRIRENTSYEKYINYRCEGKKNVIGVRNLINKLYHKKENNTLLFFVDRDYNFESVPSNIYVTDFYSIENFYLNEKTFKDILENFMELETDSINYNLAIKYYKKCYKIYSKLAVKLNSFYYTIREYEKIHNCCRTNLNSIKFLYFIKDNSIDNLSMINPTFSELKKIYNVDYKIQEIEFKKNMTLFDENNHNNFRGKFELEFLKWFLSTLRIEIKNGNLNFQKQIVCNYDFNMDIMRVLSKYAYTPVSLLEYIVLHSKKKLCNEKKTIQS